MLRETLQYRSVGMLTIASFISLGMGSRASADPLAGEVLKFQQLPLGDQVTDPTTVFPGHDELSTATLGVSTTGKGYTGTFAADDFSDNVTSPIVDVQWWGSYLPNSTQGGEVQKFLVSFEANVPANSATGFSQPGTPLSAQVVTLAPINTPASGTFTQQAVSSYVSGPDGQLYQYNAELANPFPEQAGTTYWLKIVALTGNNTADTGVEWGWHNRDYTIPDPYAAPPGDSILGTNDIGQPVYHYEDDAVTGDVSITPGLPLTQGGLVETNMSPLLYSSNPVIDGFGATGVVPPSEDLSFDLYYVPEPAALPLLATGMFLLRRYRGAKATTA